MKQLPFRARRNRESGAALITVLLITICTAMLLAASLTVAQTTSELGWKQSNSEAAMQLADAGIDSELQYIATHAGSSNTANMSSQPVVYTGVTVKKPGASGYVDGRPGTVTGYSGGTYYVYSSNDAAGTTAWDGTTTPFYVTCAAVVKNCWHTVQISSTATSAFNVYGTFALGSDPSAPTSVTVGPSSTVTVTGPAGVNGTVSLGTGGSFTAPTITNADTAANPTGQFTSGNVTTGGTLQTTPNPVLYPPTTTVINSSAGVPSTTPVAVTWPTLIPNTGTVYHYKSSNQDVTLSVANCKPYAKCPTNLMNSAWNGIHQKPFNSAGLGGGGKKIQTMIFEPGDYYFTAIQLDYDCTKELVLDPQGFASGAAPGQIRFWVYDPLSGVDGNPADYIQQPFVTTLANGTTTPDSGSFRIYYAKDGCSLTFSHPTNILDAGDNPLTSDFNYYLGVWGCSKQAGDTSSLKGSTIALAGTSSSSTGAVSIHGSLLADKLSCSGTCKIAYTPSKLTSKDPANGAKVASWSCIG